VSKCKLFFSLHFVIAVAEVTDSNTLIYLKKKKRKIRHSWHTGSFAYE